MDSTKKWTFDLTEKAKRELAKLDQSTQKSIVNYIEKLNDLQNPRMRGHQLQGTLREY